MFNTFYSLFNTSYSIFNNFYSIFNFSIFLIPIFNTFLFNFEYFYSIFNTFNSKLKTFFWMFFFPIFQYFLFNTSFFQYFYSIFNTSFFNIFIQYSILLFSNFSIFLIQFSIFNTSFFQILNISSSIFSILLFFSIFQYFFFFSSPKIIPFLFKLFFSNFFSLFRRRLTFTLTRVRPQPTTSSLRPPRGIRPRRWRRRRQREEDPVLSTRTWTRTCTAVPWRRPRRSWEAVASFRIFMLPTPRSTGTDRRAAAVAVAAAAERGMLSRCGTRPRSLARCPAAPHRFRDVAQPVWAIRTGAAAAHTWPRPQLPWRVLHRRRRQRRRPTRFKVRASANPERTVRLCNRARQGPPPPAAGMPSIGRLPVPTPVPKKEESSLHPRAAQTFLILRAQGRPLGRQPPPIHIRSSISISSIISISCHISTTSTTTTTTRMLDIRHQHQHQRRICSLNSGTSLATLPMGFCQRCIPTALPRPGKPAWFPPTSTAMALASGWKTGTPFLRHPCPRGRPVQLDDPNPPDRPTNGWRNPPTLLNRTSQVSINHF